MAHFRHDVSVPASRCVDRTREFQKKLIAYQTQTTLKELERRPRIVGLGNKFQWPWKRS